MCGKVKRKKIWLDAKGEMSQLVQTLPLQKKQTERNRAGEEDTLSITIVWNLYWPISQRTAQQRLQALVYTVSKLVRSNNIIGSVTVWCCQRAQGCILADEVNWKRCSLQLKSISVIIIQKRILPWLFFLPV